MKAVCTVSNQMSGSVSHHANHIIGWSRDHPIYCSGHSVNGKQTTGNQKVLVQGKQIALRGDSGTTNCSCCGRDYTNTDASDKVIVGGRGVVCVGDKVNIHGAGTGRMINGNNKIVIRDRW